METDKEVVVKTKKYSNNEIELKENKPDIKKEVGFEKDKTEKDDKNCVVDDDGGLESVLNEFKLYGKYHVKFLLLMGFLIYINIQRSIQYVFTAENIEYTCKHNTCEHTALLSLGRNSTMDFKCHKYDLLNVNGTCLEDNSYNSSVTDCNEWVYEKSDSFVAEFNLGCKDWKRTLVGTIHSTGYIIGLLILGPISDRFGRKKLLIFTALISGVIGIWKSLVTSYWLFIVLEFVEPMLGDSSTTTFATGIEMVTKKQRPATMIINSICSTIGYILLTVIAYLTPNWRIFVQFVYAPSFLVIFYIFFIDESLRWLLSKGKKSEAEEIIRRAAKMNKIVIDERKIGNLRCEENISNLSFLSTIKLTFSSKKLMLRALSCICMWFTSLFNDYSLLINSVSLSGDKYINFGLMGVSRLFTGILLLYTLTKFKRKGPLIFALTLTGVFCITQSFVPKEYRWLSILLLLFGRASSSFCLGLSYLYTTELFPTYTRNTLLSICSSIGRTATMLAPQTPLLLKYSTSLPSLIVGVLSLFTASLVTLMPDTSEDALPDNVQQAEAVGRRQKNGVTSI